MQDPNRLPEESAMIYVMKSIRNLPDKLWTSVELHELYQKNGRKEKNRSRFFTKLITHMNNKRYVFKSPGIANIVMIQEKASSLFKLVSHSSDDDNRLMQRIVSRIKEEIKMMPNRKTEYIVINAEKYFWLM